jgi:YggT family protein
MFVLANLVAAIATILDILLLLYMIALFAVVVISWFTPASRHPFVMFLRMITYPVLNRLRRAFPFLVQAGFDLSPIVLFFIIYFVQRFLVRSLYDLAARLA